MFLEAVGTIALSVEHGRGSCIRRFTYTQKRKLHLLQIYVALPLLVYIVEKLYRFIWPFALKTELVDVELAPGCGPPPFFLSRCACLGPLGMRPLAHARLSSSLLALLFA